MQRCLMKEAKMTKKNIPKYKILIAAFLIIFINIKTAYAGVINMDINGNAAETVEILGLLTVVTLLPSILIMMTSFTRIIIVLS